MVYDLTTVLTTIAAASASFVAILGGFIASKLIAVNGEREETINRLADIDEEIAYRTGVLEVAQQENTEEDALCFVLDHMDPLMDWYVIDTVYKHEEHPDISLETLRPYWEKARDIVKQYQTAIKEKDSLNADDVPRKLAMNLREDDFGYEVCKKIGTYYRKLERIEQRKRNPYDITSFVADIETPRISGLWYSKNEEIIKEQETAIGWLKLQREQVEKTKNRLHKPKGIVGGLVVFALFSILCIVLPLAFSPFTTTCYNHYLFSKIAFLSIFVLGLVGTFGYLVWLLKWNDQKKEKNNDNKRKTV